MFVADFGIFHVCVGTVDGPLGAFKDVVSPTKTGPKPHARAHHAHLHLAVLVGIVGIVPQLISMLRTRSAGAQSTLGWALGALANLGLGFVNGLGYHATVLAAGNGLSLAGCVIAA